MGTNSIKNIILTAITHKSMGKKVAGYSLNEGELAKHSISCALASELIASKISGLTKETAFVGGLLHDIGKIVMDQYIHGPFDELLKRSQFEKKSFSEIENDEMDISHAEIGGLIAKAWNLPSQLVEAIIYHHEPPPVDKLINPQFVFTVHLADIITLTLGVGVGAEGLCYKLDPDTLNILKLVPEDIDYFIAELPEQLNILDNLR